MLRSVPAGETRDLGAITGTRVTVYPTRCTRSGCRDLNPGPLAPKASALPAALHPGNFGAALIITEGAVAATFHYNVPEVDGF